MLNNVSDQKVLRYFYDISNVPRCSGDEKRISDYLVEFGKSRNLEVIQDQFLNVLIKKPGTMGYEDADAVIIQNHIDMVCVKAKDSSHDFQQDPLKLRTEGDMIYAECTTLGADNGIGVAYALELLDADDIAHPPLEILMTSGEEVGMLGATALDPRLLKGKHLINIDGGPEGVFFTACAGAVRVEHTVAISWEAASNGFVPYLLQIEGLRGGHSGADIHLGKANANKQLGRILSNLSEAIDFGLASIIGGDKPNVIPKDASALLMIKPQDISLLGENIAQWNNILKREFRVSDPDIKVLIEEQEIEVKRLFSGETAERVIGSLVLIPNGVQTMNMEIKGLAESSSNLGCIRTLEDKVVLESTIRSELKSLKQSILNQAITLARFMGAELTPYNDYPEWEYDPNSKLRCIFDQTYQEQYGYKAEFTSIHAGLECGILKQKMPDIDIISFGPSYYEEHSITEHLSISSTERTWEYLKAVLKNMKP